MLALGLGQRRLRNSIRQQQKAAVAAAPAEADCEGPAFEELEEDSKALDNTMTGALREYFCQGCLYPPASSYSSDDEDDGEARGDGASERTCRMGFDVQCSRLS